MAFHQQLPILFIRQAESLLEVEVPHLFIRHVQPEHLPDQSGKKLPGLTQAVVKIHVNIHRIPLPYRVAQEPALPAWLQHFDHQVVIVIAAVRIFQPMRTGSVDHKPVFVVQGQRPVVL